jgi:hypothetical protein
VNDSEIVSNSSLDGNARRAIDIHEGEEIDARALKALIHAAVALNVRGRKAAPPRAWTALMSGRPLTSPPGPRLPSMTRRQLVDNFPDSED